MKCVFRTMLQFAGCAALLAATCGALHAQQQVRGISVSEQYLLQMANAERAQRGLPQLRWDDALYQAAQRHCEQMAARQSISHQYPGEMELAERGKAAGAKFSRIAENVAEAPTAVRIHDAWMQSEGHRENLLDALSDSVGIAVIRRNGQLYAVEDFDRQVQMLTLDEQEATVAQLVQAAAPIDVATQQDAARRTCAMETGWAGARQPYFVMRYTAGELTRIPDQLKQKLVSGRYREAAVGACVRPGSQPFTSYNIAVMLFP